MRYPLVDFHGNCGSQDGDGPAHMRYTEARLSKYSEAMLKDMKKEVVDFVDNFDGTEKEPKYLPAKFPNLLVNPTSGVAVGMACSFAPHNLTEVVYAILATLDNEDISIKEIMNFMPGPDFPTGGVLINKDELLSAYQTGKGRARVRGRYTIEKNKKEELIVFNEIPHGVEKEALIESIISCVNEKKIVGISDIEDLSSNEGMRLIVSVAKNANSKDVVRQLFAHTKLENTYSINQVCLVDGVPKLVNLKEMIFYYLEHQKDVIRRRTQCDLEKAIDRLNILDGLLIALANIDEIIKIIKASGNTASAKETLEKTYGLNSLQSEAIVELKLRKLTSLEQVEIQNEQKDCKAMIDTCNNILSNSDALKEVIKTEIKEMLSGFKNDKRLTDITQVSEEKVEELPEINEKLVSVLTKNGSIKTVLASSFTRRKPGATGAKAQADIPISVVSTNTKDSLLLFSSLGKAYKLPVSKIPTTTNAAKGVDISSLLSLSAGETIKTTVSSEQVPEFITFVTEQGMVKKTVFSEYAKGSTKGAAAIRLKDGDSIKNVLLTNEEDILVVTRKGLSIRTSTKDIRPMGRVTLGAKIITLDPEDSVVGAVLLDNTEVGIFLENGLGKRVSSSDFPIQNKGGSGTVCSTDLVADICLLSDADDVLVSTKTTSVLVSAKEISVIGRGAKGKIICKNGSVVSATKI